MIQIRLHRAEEPARWPSRWQPADVERAVLHDGGVRLRPWSAADAPCAKYRAEHAQPGAGPGVDARTGAGGLLQVHRFIYSVQIKPSDVPAALRSVRTKGGALVAPTVNVEAFGRTPVEAHLLGVVPIGTNEGGHLETIRHGDARPRVRGRSSSAAVENSSATVAASWCYLEWMGMGEPARIRPRGSCLN